MESFDEFDEYLLCINNLQREVITPGSGLKKPTLGSTCKTVIQILSGEVPRKEFEERKEISVILSHADEPFDRVIEFCLSLMSVGEESKFFLPSVKFMCTVQLTLIECKFAPHLVNLLDLQKFQIAKTFKEDGVALYANRKYGQALVKFNKSLQFALSINAVYSNALSISSDLNMEEVRHFRVALYNNLALCQLRFRNYQAVKVLCTKSLDIELTAKAYYRRGLAHIGLLEHVNAKDDFTDALKIENNNAAALERLNYVRGLIRDSIRIYNSNIKKMFH